MYKTSQAPIVAVADPGSGGPVAPKALHGRFRAVRTVPADRVGSDRVGPIGLSGLINRLGPLTAAGWSGRAGLRPAMLMMVLLLGSATLSGCDYFAEKKLVPNVHTEADVRTFMGTPEMISEEPDGSKRLEYPRSPMGAQTYFVYIGPDGKYRGMEKAMSEANFAKVKVGMSRDDVRRLLGKQTESTPLPLKNEEVWSWRYEADGSQVLFFNAHFDKASGKVARISRNQDWRSMGNG